MQKIGLHALFSFVGRMTSSRVPALVVHLTLEIIHAVLPCLQQRPALRVIRPFETVAAGKSNSTLFVFRTGLTLVLAYANAQSAISLVTLRIDDAKPAGKKLILVFFITDTEGLGVSHVERGHVFVSATCHGLLSRIDPGQIGISHGKNLVMLCVINVTNHPRGTRIEGDLITWMHTSVLIT